MKNILLILTLLVPALMSGQNSSHGVIKSSYITDTLITKDPTTPGRAHWIVMYSTGFMKCQGVMQNGKREGVWREYVGNTGLLSRSEEFKAGKKNGATLTMNSSGMVITDETYENDTLNGLRTTYTETGRIKVTETFRKGILEGQRKSYYDDGTLQQDVYYINGEMDGVAKWYLQTGKLTVEYTYRKGIMDGPAKLYDLNGLIKQEGQYANDAEDGEWKEYTDGKLIKTILYKNGTVVKETLAK